MISGSCLRETVMYPGMVVGFVAGEENGYHLVNRTEEIADFIVVASKPKGDRGLYPDDDLSG